MREDSSHTPPQFFVTSDMVAGDEVCLTGDLFRHAVAKRLRPGEPFRAVCGQHIYDALIVTVDNHRAVGRVVATRPVAGPPADIHLYAALLKGPKFDLVIEKVTELGVRSIHPMVTARVVAKVDGEKAPVRRERWARIAKASCEQSGRHLMPEIADVSSFDAILREAAGPIRGKRLIAHEHKVAYPGMSGGVSGASDPPGASRMTVGDAVSVLIGPEGGFDSEEVDKALGAGFIPFSLGPHILKAETASIAAVAILMRCPALRA